MARIRTIKPDFFTSRTVVTLSLRARLTFVGLWTYVDDSGRGVDEPRLIKAAIWPLDDAVTPAEVGADVDELERAGLLFRYDGPDKRGYLMVRNWQEHQKINHPSASKHPAPPPRDRSRRPTVSRCADSGSPTGDIPLGKERKGKEQGKDIPAAPVLADASGGWTGEAYRIWLDHVGAVKVGRLGNALKPLVDEYGWETAKATGPPVAAVLRCYCKWAGYKRNGRLPDRRDGAARDLTWVKPENFAETYQEWAEMLKPLDQSA